MSKENKKAHIRKARDSAVSLDLAIDDDDALIEMMGRESGLFYITKKKVVRYRSPDSIDPDLEHESATWIQSLVLPHGASDPIVARTIIQTNRMLERFFPKGSEKYIAVSDISWEVMNSLVSLRFIRKRLEKQTNDLITEIEKDIKAYTMASKPKMLPMVEYFDIEFRSFVNEVRRALNAISDLFFPLTGEDGLDQGYFHKALAWAEKERGADSLLAQMLRNDQRWIKTWIDIRTAIEHPKKDKYIETINFTLEPNGTITIPTWRFVHPDYDMKRPQNLLVVMQTCIESILKFYEDLLFFLLDGHQPSYIKIMFEVIPEDQRDKDVPLRYKLY